MSTVFAPRPPVKAKGRKPLAPASGSVKALRPIGDVNDQAGEIEINGRPYYLALRGTCYTLTGYDARKAQVTSYDLPADLSGCDCPDATFRDEREGGCKHRKALRA